MKRTQLEKKDAISVSSIIATCLISLFAITLIMLFFWGILSSLKTRLDFRSNMFGFPTKWKFSNYIDAFKILKVPVQTASGGLRDVLIVEMIMNSFLTSIIPEVILVIYTALCTYTLAKYKFKLRKLIYNALIVVMILPIIGNLAASIEFQKSIGVYDNLIWQFVTAPTIWGGNFLVLYAIYRSLSWEYAEAAFVDGAGHHMVFWVIMLPLSKTILVVLFILGFIARWNNYQLSLVYLPSFPTLAYGLYDFQFSKDEMANSLTIQLAANIMSCIPTFLLFIFFKDKMMGSLTIGGIKG